MLRFIVLASGSGGNASLVETSDFCLLLDAGLGPQVLDERLAQVGRARGAVQAVLLTHTHSDHWNDRTLGQLHQQGVTLFCSPEHQVALRKYGNALAGFQSSGRLCTYTPGSAFEPAPGLKCRAFAVRHDSGPTFGFRIEGPGDLFGESSVLAYAADLGCWDEAVAQELCDADILAMEFNHDVEMEASSGRGAHLIARVLGDEGHLSNAQAASLLRAVVAGSIQGRLRHLVQLHLSRQCNRRYLARAAAEAVLRELAPHVRLHTAQQDRPGPVLQLDGPANSRRPARSNRPRTRRASSAQRDLFDEPE
jgi:phosphoribosyl 1,2-cyclic phosphodiesterase